MLALIFIVKVKGLAGWLSLLAFGGLVFPFFHSGHELFLPLALINFLA